MKIKLDENLPKRLADILTQMGHDVDTVVEERIVSAPDADVLDAARVAGRFLITQDMDFSDIRRFSAERDPGLLVIRLRQPGRSALVQRILQVFETENVESWQGCFVVATDRKIRVRKPV